MEQDKVYGSIRKAHSRVALWPGDRSSRYPLTESVVDEGHAFLLPYSHRNSCHTCEIVGTAFFAFDFDRYGRLNGIRFVRIEQPPKKVVIKADSHKESEQIRFVVMTEEGKEFTVRLDSNRTTGYHWRPVEPLDERIIRINRSEYIPFDTIGAGAGGEESWTFSAVGKGEAKVVMEYMRPWEKGVPALKTAIVRVSVKPAGQK
jgi:inhibitor of cysteine peptidase